MHFDVPKGKGVVRASFSLKIDNYPIDLLVNKPFRDYILGKKTNRYRIYFNTKTPSFTVQIYRFIKQNEDLKLTVKGIRDQKGKVSDHYAYLKKDSTLNFIEQKYDHSHVSMYRNGRYPHIGIEVSSESEFYAYRIVVHLNDGRAIYLSNGEHREMTLMGN